MGVAAYNINIVGLSNKEHRFQFEIGDEFFRRFGTDIVSEGTFQVELLLDKHETFIEVAFKIDGKAHLICDRSLEPFDFPINSNNKIVFKYGDAYQEMTDEIVIIPRETATLELGQYIYEFIALGIPLKKLHPRFQDEVNDEDDSEGKIVYSSETSEEKKDDEEIDPRWDILKKLK
ncbi:DUF177 domain-containing protein [Chryseolinea sp. H1M3-3]|uniref:YceD family protein n=1 Tax=Chryseolinea sp. H1M3-3 TaxID=3034144 RepID=UPI0023EADCE6|nr:DUF177 domain-containing protein [Chryseolinea sp. H1M3-3]